MLSVREMSFFSVFYLSVLLLLYAKIQKAPDAAKNNGIRGEYFLKKKYPRDHPNRESSHSVYAQ